MLRPTHRRPSRRKSAKRRSAPSTAALRKLVRPIVEELMAKQLERLENRLDAQDAAEAQREPGEISHEEFWRKRGL